MSLRVFVLLGVCIMLFSVLEAHAINYDVGITLSKTCLAMIKNNITSTCPTYEEILVLFPDNTIQEISGKFVFKDGYLQRDHTNYKNHFNFYTYQPNTIWIDPPGDIVGRIATITIEPSLPDYLLKPLADIKNNTQYTAHSRWVDTKCYRATITAADWIYLTGDTINYMMHQCDPAFTGFNHIKEKYLGSIPQDIGTSNKYKLDQMVLAAKEKYKTYHIGNDTFENLAVTTDEDQR